MEAKAGERDRKRRQLLQLAAGAVQQGVAQLQVDKVGDTLQLAQRDHAFGRGGDDQAEELAHVPTVPGSLEEALEIGFNPGYFSDVLKVLETTEFRLELKDARSAAVVREESDDQRYVYLVMPLNLGG